MHSCNYCSIKSPRFQNKSLITFMALGLLLVGKSEKELLSVFSVFVAGKESQHKWQLCTFIDLSISQL